MAIRDRTISTMKLISRHIPVCLYFSVNRLSEDMFSREDMEEFSDFLQHQCHSQITQDISVLINMSALAINALLESAQEQGIGVLCCNNVLHCIVLAVGGRNQ